MSIQTETILRQVITERIKPVVFLDNMDGALLELQMGWEDLYQMLCRIVDNCNTVIATYADRGGPMGPVMVRKRERERDSKYNDDLHSWDRQLFSSVLLCLHTTLILYVFLWCGEDVVTSFTQTTPT